MFHFIAADSPTPIEDHKSVRAELEAYNKLLLEKPEYIFISRSDSVEKEILLKIKKDFKKLKKETIAISIIEPESIEVVKKILNTLIKEKNT